MVIKKKSDESIVKKGEKDLLSVVVSSEERIRALERKVEELTMNKSAKVSETVHNDEVVEVVEKKPRKNMGVLWILVVLVILLLVVDILSLAVYYKPNFNFLSNPVNGNVVSQTSGSSTCSDGTLNGICSKNKPYYCDNGNLVKSAYHCGCPSGYVVSFQDCKLSS